MTLRPLHPSAPAPARRPSAPRRRGLRRAARAGARALAAAAMLLAAACADSSADQPQASAPPAIAWAETSARFRVYVGETLMLVPDVAPAGDTFTFAWYVAGRLVSTASFLSFTPAEPGEYYIRLVVANRCGQTEDEVKVTALPAEGDPAPPIPRNDSTFAWHFAWTRMNMAQGRTVRIRPAMMENTPPDARFAWSIDGQPAPAASTAPAGGMPACVFAAGEQGTHEVELTMTSSTATAVQRFSLTVCPPPGTFRRTASGKAVVCRVFEYMPAPGHQVNGYIITGEAYPPGCTHEQACDSVLSHFLRQWSVSLGAQGGYVVAGFDHSVDADGQGPDIAIKGNPFSYQSEPGIIWVSQDDNGDGLPNDQWFELAGSEYGTPRHTTDYAVTYYRPAAPRSATPWRDCTGQTGYVPYMSYWNPQDYYWQPWVEGTEHTFCGSRLQDRSTYSGGYSDMPPYDWGYADNLGTDYAEGPEGYMGRYHIAHARTWDGQPAGLRYADFVKVQTAQTGATPNLGEISTEVYTILDIHCAAAGPRP